MGEMRFTYHIGLHCTDEDRILACLLENEDQLEAAGSVAARAGRFRPALRKAMLSLKGEPAPIETQKGILKSVLDGAAPRHVLFSSDSFLCVPLRAVVGPKLYPLVGQRAPWIRNLFPDAPARFCLALRNPATLLPALQARFADELTFDAYLNQVEPEALSWADMIHRLKASVPDAEVIVWCNEDAPLLWPHVLRLLAELPPDTPLSGEDDFLESLMRPEGLSRLKDYLAERPHLATEHRRRIVSAFLDKFADPTALEDDLSNHPQWGADRIARLTEAYEADIARIGRMDDVQLILPSA